MDDLEAPTRVERGRPTLERGPTPHDGEAEPLPATIGRFIVLSRVGSGAMGVVYAAFDPQLERRVALKIVRSARAGTSPSGGPHARLLREAQAMAKLSHPNVAAVHEVGEWQGDVFLAMEYVAGQTLRTWLYDPIARLPPRRRWREVCAAFLQAGEGLAAAHAAGVVHRDFKPDNVLVGADGRVRVVDFGLARGELRDGASVLAPGDVELTRAGSVLGTPAYMAPEQHLSRVCDARSDQFSFCVALWEALYGERPYLGGDIEELGLRKLDGPPQAVPKGSHVPRWLLPVLTRGLQPEPEQRHADMRALLDALRRDPWQRRRRLLVGGLVVAAAVAAGLGWQRVEERAAAEFYAARASVCAGAEEPLAGVWDDDRRIALARRFAGDALQPIGRGVQQTLDRWADGWVRARVEVCQATRLRGQLPESLMLRRNACLDRALAAARSRVDALLAADAATLQRAGELLGLPALGPCTEGRQNSHMDAPDDPAQAAQLAERVERTAARFDFAVFAGAEAEIEALHREAAALGYRPLLARVALLRGRYYGAVSRYAESRREYLEGLRLAEVSRDDRTAIEALVGLLDVLSLHLRSLPEAEALVLRLNAAFERLGEDDPGLAARVLRAHAKVSAESLRYEEAIALFDRSAREHLRDHQPIMAVTAWGNIGVLLNRMNQLRAAISHFERALWRLVHAGDVSPQMLAVQHINMGRSYLLLGEYALARRQFERAEALTRAAMQDDPERIASNAGLSLTRFNLGLAMLDDEAPADALPLLAEALAFRRKVYGETSVFTNTARAAIARAHLALGDVDAAARGVAEAAANHVPGGSDGEAALLRELEFLGGVIAGRRGRVAEAVERLGRLRADPQATADLACRAAIDLDLALADLLWTTPARRADAVELVGAGLTRTRDLADAGGCSHRLLDRMKLWLVAHPE